MNTPDFMRFFIIIPLACVAACARPFDQEPTTRSRLAYVSSSETTSIDQEATSDSHPLLPDQSDHFDRYKPSSLSDSSTNADGQNLNQGIAIDESPSPPNQIAGSNLRCFLEESSKDSELEMGCRFEDKDEVRVEVSRIAKKVVFAAPIVLFSGVSRSFKVLAGDAQYDVVFNFSGAPIDALKEAARSANFIVNLYGLANGDAAGSLAVDGNHLLASPTHVGWSRESGFDVNRNGECDVGEECVFQGSGLLWTRDEGKSFSALEAEANCKNLDGGGQGWRLPTLEDAEQAYTKGIADLEANYLLNLNDSYYWLEKDLESDTSAFSLLSGIPLSQAANVRSHALCVRAIATPIAQTP